VPLDNFESDDRFYTQLGLCQDKNSLFNCLEEYLSKKLLKTQSDPIVRSLAAHLINSPAHGALNAGMSGIGLSRRRIEQRFLNSTGLSMGMFVRKVRFQKAVHLLKESPTDGNLFDIGYDAGYYDQSHFISDFKAFSGLSPKNFRGQTTDLQDFLKSLVLTC